MSLAFHHGHGSPAILEYREERFGKGKARLYPGTAQVRARIEALPYFEKTCPPNWRS